MNIWTKALEPAALSTVHCLLFALLVGLLHGAAAGVIAFVASLTGVYLLAVLILWRGW